MLGTIKKVAEIFALTSTGSLASYQLIKAIIRDLKKKR